MNEYRFTDGTEYVVTDGALACPGTGDYYDGPAEEVLCPELLRLAEELTSLRREHEAQKALLEHELTAGAEEIRQMRVEGDKADRGLVAQLGAVLGLEIPAAVLDSSLSGSPFQTSLGAELLCTAWALRQDRNLLAEEVERLKARDLSPFDRPAEHVPGAALEAVRTGAIALERARIRRELHEQGVLAERERLRPLLEESLRALHSCVPDCEHEERRRCITALRAELGKE